MGFSLDEYGDAMRAVKLPLSADDVSLTRDRFLDAREAVTAAEQAIHAAQGTRGAALEPLYVKLQQARDAALEAQEQFQRIGQYGASLEAQALANQQRKTREAEARKQEAAQVAANEAEKEAFKQAIRPAWIACGDSPQDFEQRFNAPVSGLWAQHVAERVARREREMGQAWKDRYHSMHL